MNLHDELLADQQVRVQCRVCIYLATLSEQEQVEWKAEFAYPTDVVSNASLHRALKRRGIAIGGATLSIHRRNHVPAR